MKAEDVKVYREIQKNAERGLKGLETLSEKVYDEGLALQTVRQMIKYSEIRGKAMDKLLQGRTQIYKKNMIAEMLLTGELHSKTLLDNSTSHVAQLLIEESNRGITQMCRVLNHNKFAGSMAVEMAKEFIEFEEKNIERIKKFL